MPLLEIAVPARSGGGLMSYGANVFEENRLAGGYVGRILRGEKPADLPVHQVTKLEFIVDLGQGTWHYRAATAARPRR
jgi:hypothetical protein